MKKIVIVILTFMGLSVSAFAQSFVVLIENDGKASQRYELKKVEVSSRHNQVWLVHENERGEVQRVVIGSDVLKRAGYNKNTFVDRLNLQEATVLCHFGRWPTDLCWKIEIVRPSNPIVDVIVVDR